MEQYAQVPTFSSTACDDLKADIVGLLQKQQVTVGGYKGPIFFAWDTVKDYPDNTLKSVLTAVKNNTSNICQQIIAGIEKVDAKNKGVVNDFFVCAVIFNTAGKSANSKKAEFGLDGVLKVYTIFEDAMNCAYYLERKAITALNEFRAPPGSSPPPKFGGAPAPAAAPAAAPAPVAVAAPAPVVKPAPAPAPVVAPSPVIAPAPVAAPAPAPAPVYATPSSPAPSPVSSPAPTHQPPTDTGNAGAAPPSSSAFGNAPVYADAAAETLKREILGILGGQTIKLDPALAGPDVIAPIVVDWDSFSSYQGSPLTAVLRTTKGALANICGQVASALGKVDPSNRGNVHKFLRVVIIQNFPGKSSAGKKATMYLSGQLIVNTVFEDNINCAYYLEKKVVAACDEFRVPPGSVPPPPLGISAPAVVPSAVPTTSTPTTTATTTTTTTTPSPSSSSSSSSPAPSRAAAAPAPVVAPVPVPVPVVAAPPPPPPAPKPKGRPEMAGLPFVDDAITMHNMREIVAMAASQVITDDEGVPIGAPIYFDWKSLFVYQQGAKQSTVIRNVHVNTLKLCRDILYSIKLACTDPNCKNSVVTYLRSVTVSHVTGSSTSSKKVVYEDGHLTLVTFFEDASNCSLYFESKILQELGVRQKGKAPAKPDALTAAREEVDAKIHAHYDNPLTQLIPASTTIEVNWSSMGKQLEELAVNAASAVTSIMLDYVTILNALNEHNRSVVRSEIKQVILTYAMNPKRKILFVDGGGLNLNCGFDSKAGASEFRDSFAKEFDIIIKKAHIRDDLMKQWTAQLSQQLELPVFVNPWIPVKHYPDVSVLPVVFDWNCIHHVNHTPEFQLEHLNKIIHNLTSPGPNRMVQDAFKNVCSYDVGKHAVMSLINKVTLCHIMKPKDEALNFDDNGVLKLSFTWDNWGTVRCDTPALVRTIKEKLNVAVPCAVQDTVEPLLQIESSVSRSVGKNIPLIIDWEGFVTSQQFVGHYEQYNLIKKIVVEAAGNGLSGGGSLVTLCHDKLVQDAAAAKIDKILIRVSPQNKIGHEPQRKTDPNVLASWEQGTTLVYTINLNDGLNMGYVMKGWHYQTEMALGTRPPKVARAIQAAAGPTAKLSQELSTLIYGKQSSAIPVVVEYDEFIRENEFALWLDEPEYLAVIENAAYNVPAKGLLRDDSFGGLCTYDSVRALIQDRLKKVVVRVAVDNKYSSPGTLTLNNKELTIGLNLISLTRSNSANDFKGWRLDLEDLLDLRSAKIDEEIHQRIKLPHKNISDAIGSPVKVDVDWKSVIAHPSFANNHENYIEVLHIIGETIVKDYLSQNFGVGQLVEYNEVKKYLQENLSTVKIVADATRGSCLISYEKANKSLVLHVEPSGTVQKVLKGTHADFESWGRQIETAMHLRPLRTQCTIARASPVLDTVAAKLSEAITSPVKVVIDWSFLENAKWAPVLDYIPQIHTICNMSEEWLPVIGIVRENHTMRDLLKENVKTFTMTVDPDSLINESEYRQNEIGVDYARISYKDIQTNDHIVAVVNLNRVLKGQVKGMEWDLKTELLVTPDRAQARLERKKDEEYRERKEANAEYARRQQLRAMEDGNRIQDRILREMRR